MFLKNEEACRQFISKTPTVLLFFCIHTILAYKMQELLSFYEMNYTHYYKISDSEMCPHNIYIHVNGQDFIIYRVKSQNSKHGCREMLLVQKACKTEVVQSYIVSKTPILEVYAHSNTSINSDTLRWGNYRRLHIQFPLMGERESAGGILKQSKTYFCFSLSSHRQQVAFQ